MSYFLIEQEKCSQKCQILFNFTPTDGIKNNEAHKEKSEKFKWKSKKLKIKKNKNKKLERYNHQKAFIKH